MLRKRWMIVGLAACWMVVPQLRAEDINITQSNTEIKTTLNQYDAGGSQTTQVLPSSITYQYDSTNQVTNTLTHATVYTYDANETVTQTPAAGNTFTYTYDDDGANGGSFAGSGGIPDIHTANGRTYTYTYDANDGGLTQYSDPDGRTVTYTYDAVGSGGPSSVTDTDPAGNTTSYTYDGVNRVIRGNTDNPGSASDNSQSGSVTFDPLTTFTYDALGRMSGSGAGRLDVELQDTTPGDQGILFQYDYNYDPILRPTQNTYDSGNTPGTLSGSLLGLLKSGDTYVYTYSYDIPSGLAGSSEMDLAISPVPLPKTAYAGALLMGGLSITQIIRRRRVLI